MKKLLILFFLPLITIRTCYSKPIFLSEASNVLTDKDGNLSGSAAANMFTSGYTRCHDGWSSAGPCTTSNRKTPKGREALVPFLGVAIKESNKMDGVIITNIIKKSPAYEYGLKTGDKIISIGGVKINSEQDFKSVLNTVAVGFMWSTNYRISRNNTLMGGQLSVMDRDYFIDKILLKVDKKEVL